MRTLIITNSYDATSDLLIIKMGSENFIRINYDRPQDWKINLSVEKLIIESSLGKFTNEDIAKCIWRKPFLSNPLIEPFSEKFYLSELKYLLYELVTFMNEQGKLRFNLPYPDYLLGKVHQQRTAVKYLTVPNSNILLNITPSVEDPTIAKSLSAEQFSDGKVLYTVDVTNKELSPDLWYLQDKVVAEFDLTIVHIYGKNFGFQLSRTSLTGMDWRKEQLESIQLWEWYDIPNYFEENINKFMKELGLVYGRLDFLNDKNFTEPYFLEVNKNGQWAWLDPNFNNGLFAEICDVINPNTV